jgi:hypothetical protein
MPWCVTLDYSFPLDLPGFRQPATPVDGAIATAELAVSAVQEQYFVFHPFPAGAVFDSFKPQIAAEAAQQLKQQVCFLRCIFGNPFRRINLDPRWLNFNVIETATAIYESREFDEMGVLADALLNAGCDSDELLNHCRGDGPHVFGCWVLDLIRSKRV